MVEIFIDSDELEIIPLTFLLCVYGYILYSAATLIGGGSEILQNLYPDSSVVAGLLIPILGAVPDGMMILMSGLGPIEEAQEQLNIGIGTLAGSTIMLLTAPMAAGLYLNRRKLDPATGKAGMVRKRDDKGKIVVYADRPEKFDWSDCATVFASTKQNSKIMMFASLTFLIIQIPALVFQMQPSNIDTPAHREHWFAGAGLAIASVLFCAYCYYQISDPVAQENRPQKSVAHWLVSDDLRKSFASHGGTPESVFQALDADNDDHLTVNEIKKGLKLLGYENVDDKIAMVVFSKMDTDLSGFVSKSEWIQFCKSYLSENIFEVTETLTNDAKADPAIVAKLDSFAQSDVSYLNIAGVSKANAHVLAVYTRATYSTYLVYSTTCDENSSLRDFHFYKCKAEEFNTEAVKVTTMKVLSPVWVNASNKLVDEFKKNKDGIFLDKVWKKFCGGSKTMDFSTLAKFNASMELDHSLPSLYNLFLLHVRMDANIAPDRITKEQFEELLASTVDTTSTFGKRISSSLKRNSDASAAESFQQSSSVEELKAEHEGNTEEHFGSDDDVEEEEDELPKAWSRNQKLAYACALLLGGTFIVSLFSDPMVEVLGNFGNAINVPPFYVSFIVTPLASNAAEVLTGLSMAAKGTNKAMANSVATLCGAATMNSTFCLAIFLGLVFFRGLEWNFTAEVTAILIVIWGVGMTCLNETMNMKHAAFIGSLFPGSVLLIYIMENVFHIA